MINAIKAAAEQFLPDIVQLRRTIHRNPERAYQEHETARLVRETLRPLGLSVQSGIAGTGVVATLQGEHPGPTVMLRADMDALPIQEESGVAYASERPGIMHACGHDVHTSSLLGTAMILHHLRARLAGTIRMIFQPSEELAPGGAKPMIDAGILRNHGKPTAAAFAQHVMPSLPAGTIGIRSGQFMASSDEIHLRIEGPGGHAASPHQRAGDPVLAAAQVIVALQSVISRHCPPGVPSVLSFGRVEALGATNIIPDTVSIQGTFRAMDEQWRSKACSLMHHIAHNTATAYGATALLTIKAGYPVVYNDPQSATLVRDAAISYVGTAHTTEVDLWFASEDFAYFLQEVPGALYLIGAGSPHALHTSRFVADEACLPVASGFMAYLAWLTLAGQDR